MPWRRGQADRLNDSCDCLCGYYLEHILGHVYTAWEGEARFIPETRKCGNLLSPETSSLEYEIIQQAALPSLVAWRHVGLLDVTQ